MNICQVFRMQRFFRQVRLSQMLMNTVVARVWSCARQSFGKLKVTSCLFAHSHALAVKCLAAALTPRSRCGTDCISPRVQLNHHFCLYLLIKIQRAVVVGWTKHFYSPWGKLNTQLRKQRIFFFSTAKLSKLQFPRRTNLMTVFAKR